MTSKWRRRRRITSPSAYSGRLCWTQWSSPAGTNCSVKPSNKTAGTKERLTGKPKRPFWKSTRDLANSPVSLGRSQRRRNWSGECPGAAGSNTMMTGYSRRHGMLQPRSSLKIGQALQSIRYKAHESLLAWVTIRKTGEPCKNGSLFACSTWHSKADSASAAATPPVAEAAISSTALSNAASSVGGYTAGTLGATMHDCVRWVCTGQQALTRKQAQEGLLFNWLTLIIQ